MDLSTLFGLFLGFLGIVVGNSLEGGHFTALVQGTAALIVFGGTLGATITANSSEDIRRSWTLLGSIFRGNSDARVTKIIRDLHEAAKLVRQEGPLALEARLKSFDPYLRMVARSYVDGLNADQIRSIYYSGLDSFERRSLGAAKVWTDAGGYAPTIGILGAVLGLIHVMGNLSDTSQLGKGIAIAFVATIYGVGSANLVFLPFANKIKVKCHQEIELREMIVECMALLATGEGPAVIQAKAQSLVGDRGDALS